MDQNRNNIYTIFIKQCFLSCFPIDCCGQIDFDIKNASGTTVGEIICKKDCCPCFLICGFKCVYNITFPLDCTPEIKLTIINAVVAIDLFYLKTK